MKLQYRETKWWAGEVPEEPKEIKSSTLTFKGEVDWNKYYKDLEHVISQFKEIAPQDQETVSHLMMTDPEWRAFNNGRDIKFDPSKLYDSGDLVFEIEYNCQGKIVGCKGCDCKQFWGLKDIDK